MECGGVIGLEQPGPTFDSLAADPSAMRRKQLQCLVASLQALAVSSKYEMEPDRLLARYV